jgi:hypothetical protein
MINKAPLLFLGHVHLSQKYPYLYVDTPKTGCSSIKKTLNLAEDNELKFLMSSSNASEYGYSQGLLNIHNRDLMPLLYPKTIEELMDAIASRAVRFCFVRNPFTRVLSAYLDKIKTNVNARRELFLRELSTPLQEILSFRDFLNLIKEQGYYQMNPHWRVQYYQSMFEVINFTHIGAFERFNDDLQLIISEINPVLLQYISKVDEHNTKITELISTYYCDSEPLNLVREIYRQDFEIFGYSQNLEDATMPPKCSGFLNQ